MEYVLQPPPLKKLSSQNLPKGVHTQHNATINKHTRSYNSTQPRRIRKCTNTSNHHPPHGGGGENTAASHPHARVTSSIPCRDQSIFRSDTSYLRRVLLDQSRIRVNSSSYDRSGWKSSSSCCSLWDPSSTYFSNMETRNIGCTQHL